MFRAKIWKCISKQEILLKSIFDVTKVLALVAYNLALNQIKLDYMITSLSNILYTRHFEIN